MSSSDLWQRSLQPVLAGFVEQTPGVAHALVASADGVPVSSSRGLPRGRARQLAGMAAGLVDLGYAVTGTVEAGRVVQTVVEMEQGLLLAIRVSDRSCLAVLAAATADRARVGYEAAQLAGRLRSLDDAGTATAVPASAPGA